MVACQKKKNRPGGRALRTTVLVLLILAALFLYVENNISQTLLDMSYAEAYALAVEVLNKAAAQMMKTGVTYDELMTVSRDASGRITLLQANTVRMNELAAQTALSAQQMLTTNERQFVRIPLGAALGIGIFAGSGPKIAVQILPVGAVSTKFSTDFESAGINQTRHRILLSLSATIRLVIPTGAKRVDVSSQISVAESIIVGEVPESFVDVNNRHDLLDLLP